MKRPRLTTRAKTDLWTMADYAVAQLDERHDHEQRDEFAKAVLRADEWLRRFVRAERPAADRTEELAAMLGRVRTHVVLAATYDEGDDADDEHPIATKGSEDLIALDALLAKLKADE